MNEGSCGTIKNEKLYTLEIFVDHVKLNPEKINIDKLPPSSLGIDFRIRDFPIFRIFHSNFEFSKKEDERIRLEKEKQKEGPKERKGKGKKKGKQKEKKNEKKKGGGKGKKGKDNEKEKEKKSDGKILFRAGKIYLFSKKPSVLIDTLRLNPLNIEIYKVKKFLHCPVEDVDKEVLGRTEALVSGCLCDQNKMADNDMYHLGRPYFLKNTYNLIDKDNVAVTGSIYFFLRLTSHNRYISMGFAIIQNPVSYSDKIKYWGRMKNNFGDEPRTIFFRNGNEKDEFNCTKVSFDDEQERREIDKETRVCLKGYDEKCELDLPPDSGVVLGFSFLCDQLARTDGYPLRLYK